MKKLAYFVSLGAFILSLAACGEEDRDENINVVPNEEVDVETDEEVETEEGE